MKAKVKKLAIHIVKRGLFAWFIMVLAVAGCQRSLMYHPQTGLSLPEKYGISMDVISLIAKDNTKITAWYSAAKEGMPTILFFHGNAGHIGYRARRFHVWQKYGFGVMALSYRGYGNSQGAPSEEGLYADGRAALTWLNTQNIKQDQILLYGESLGTGIATRLATEIDALGVVLEAPYTQISQVAKDMYPFVPVDLLLLDRYENINSVKHVGDPVLIAHGGLDDIIPVNHGKEVYDAALGKKYWLFFPEKGHNNLPIEKILRKVIEFWGLPTKFQQDS